MKTRRLISGLICLVMSFTVVGMVVFNQANNVSGLELEQAQFNLSSTDFTADSTLIDPESISGTGNFGGNIRVLPVDTVNSDAIAFRIKNLTNEVFSINTMYIQNENNFSYSLMSSRVTFVHVDGTVSESKVGTGGRGTNIPASFDGVMIIPWNEIVSIKTGGGFVWTRKAETDKLQKDSTDPAFMYPTERISFLSLYFNREAKNAGENELLFGSIYTLRDVDTDIVITEFANPIRLEGSPATVITNNDLVKVSQYPSTSATYTLKVNGVDVTADDTINLNAETAQAKYGFSPVVDYTLAKGYSLSYVELDGSILALDSIMNMDKVDSSHELNFVTVKEYIYQVGAEATLSLVDKTGVIVDVDNTLNETIDYSVVVNGLDESSYVASSKGSGSFIKEDGTTYYGNVFEIPVGFKGKIFIPFNVNASGYGTLNNLPWTNTLPDTIDSTLKLKFIKTETITAQTLETVFNNWEFISNTPAITLASNANISDGDSDFIDGIAISLDNTFLNGWTSPPAVRIKPSVDVDFNSLGLALRVKNIGENDFSSRIYLVASNNATYVPSTEMKYSLVHSDGVVEEKLVNRTIVIPAGFDGTLIMNTHNYATDNLNAVGQTNSNVIKDGLTLKSISLFINASQGDNLLLSPKLAILNLDNETVEINTTYEMENLTLNSATLEGTVYNPLVETISYGSLGVKVNDLDYDETKVNVASNSLLLGNEIVVSPLEGYQIVNATLGEDELTLNSDGTYSIIITKNYPDGATLNIEVLAKYRVNVDYDSELGSVKINDGVIEENIYYDDNEEITFSATASNGYKVKSVSVNETAIDGVDGVYSIIITATTNVKVEFEALTYKITYELDGGVNSAHNPTSYTINDSFVLGAPTKEGYEFEGWYVLDSNNEQIDILRVDAGSTGDLTIHASFVENIEEPVVPDQPEDSTPWLLIGGIGAGVVVLALGVFMFIKKRK